MADGDTTGGGRGGTSGAKHILVADDEHLVRWFIARTLEKKGHRTMEAANFHEAMRLLNLKDFDAVFADIRMLEENGLEDLHKDLVENKGMRVIACAAFMDEDSEKKLKFLGIHTLRKPFAIAEIENILSLIV